jgi:hypothetical protein
MPKNHSLHLLFFFLLCSGGIIAQSISIEKFGAVKDGGQDATPAVRKALAYIRQHPASRLIFPRGRYDFFPDLASEKYIYTTNNDDGQKRIAFLLEGLAGLEIDGQGSDFFFHGYINPFVIERCKGITLKNFSVDWERTFHSEGRIISVDKEGMELQFSEKYPYKIENGMLIFRDKKGMEYPYGNLLEFDPAKRETAYMARDQYFARNLPAREVSPGQVRLLVPGMEGIPGNIIVFNALHRPCSAIAVSDSRELRFDSLKIYHCGGMGIVAQRCRDIDIDHLDVTARPGSGRVLSLTADATHFSNCRGKLWIRHSLLENQMDDATNIHGIYIQVARRLSSTSLLLQLRHEQQVGFDLTRPGGQLELVRSTTLEAYDTLTVKRVERINKEYTEVEFTRPVPAGLLEGRDVMAAIDDHPDVIIRHCTIQKNRARGLLIGSRGKVIIDSNYFHTPGAAILFEGDGRYWFEQTGVRDVIVKDNVFENCNYGVWGNAAIQVGSGIEKEYQADSRYNRNIKIVHNTFHVFDPRIIHAYSVEGLRFADNKITASQDYPNKFPDGKRFEITSSSGVEIDDKQAIPVFSK